MGLDDLKTLNLSRNLFTKFELNTFYGLTNLEVLDLAYNSISLLDNQTFAGLISLEYLYLKSNKLKYVSSDYSEWFPHHGLTELVELDLSM